MKVRCHMRQYKMTSHKQSHTYVSTNKLYLRYSIFKRYTLIFTRTAIFGYFGQLNLFSEMCGHV